MKLVPIDWDDATLDRAIAGEFTVYRYERPVPLRLTAQERIQFEQAKVQGYVVHGKRLNLHTAFYQWCEIHDWPYIGMEAEGKYANVKMDIPSNECALSARSQELVRVAHDYASCSRSDGHVGRIYSYLHKVDRAWAAFVAESYVAIYRRNIGEEVALPSRPLIPSTNPLLPRLVEAKRLRYATTHTVRDALTERWIHYCDARDLPFLHLHEARKGRATLEVDLSASLPFTDEVRQQIRRAAQEANLIDFHELRSLSNKRWYTLTDRKLIIRQSIPTDDALYLVQTVARILERAGYFGKNDPGTTETDKGGALWV